MEDGRPRFPLMRCGHNGMATDGHGNPWCVICMCDEVDTVTVVQAGRVAECSVCGRPAPSMVSMPFFEHRPHLEHDRWYCGCKGWD